MSRVVQPVASEGLLPRSTSLTTASRVRVVGVSVLAGLAVAVLWSFELVDRTIGDNVASTLLGYEASEGAITGSLAGAAFAFVSGLAGTFTACNIAAFSALAPLVGETDTTQRRLGRVLRPLAWLAVGMLVVSATYGALGVLFSDRLPQLSTARTAGDMPLRLVQSSVIFGLIGLLLVYLGLAAVGAVPDRLARLRARLPRIDLLVLGALIGAFLIGRPFGLFFRMFEHAAEQDNPLYGAVTFALQSVGNIVIMALLFVALVSVGRGAFYRWLAAEPARPARVMGGAFLIAGTFTFVYWVLRVPAIFGYGWFPRMPWS